MVYRKTSENCDRSAWRPLTIKSPFLLFIIAFSAALIIAIELLVRQNQRDGGLVFSADINALSLSQIFPYLHLPTIIAVIYAILWSWIDLDLRRLEPFFQLSKSEAGAKGYQSLLLHYPVDFLAWVPIRAFRLG
jgi:hypothetical protein